MNPNNGLLYWASYYDTSTETQEKYKGVLFEIDPKTGEVTNLGDFQTELTSLCIQRNIQAVIGMILQTKLRPWS